MSQTEVSERLSKAINLLKAAGSVNTNTDIADTIGISRSAVSEYTSGRKQPSHKFLLAFSEKFNVRLEWLHKGHGDVFEKREQDGYDMAEALGLNQTEEPTIPYGPAEVIKLQQRIIELQDKLSKCEKELISHNIPIPE